MNLDGCGATAFDALTGRRADTSRRHACSSFGGLRAMLAGASGSESLYATDHLTLSVEHMP